MGFGYYVFDMDTKPEDITTERNWIESSKNDKRTALLEWANKHGYQPHDVFYRLDDGQIQVMTTQEFLEWEKENEGETIFLCEITIEGRQDKDYFKDSGFEDMCKKIKVIKIVKEV